MINVGFDFGTHQTKICVEDRTDKRRPKYSFFEFVDLEGKRNYVLPSVIQINKDDTLSYGYVDSENCKLGYRKNIDKEPVCPNIKKPVLQTLPKPKEPNYPSKPKAIVMDWKDKLMSLSGKSVEFNRVGEWKQKCESLKRAHENDLSAWEKQERENRNKYERDLAEYNSLMSHYYEKLKEWQERVENKQPLVFRYFKQATFASYAWDSSMSATMLSIWYVANILFLLNEGYGNTYSIQIGVPMGDERTRVVKERAVSVFLTAFDLVENVFDNDRGKFLATKVSDLTELTNWKKYSEEEKAAYGLSVFPEAYASLLPITTKGRLVNGMNILVDIGGGTTDISFFVVSGDKKQKAPMIYHYQSISKGINSIVEDSTPQIKDRMERHISLDSDIIDKIRKLHAIENYHSSVGTVFRTLQDRLRKEFNAVSNDVGEFNRSIRNRPIVFSGGGSTFQELRKGFYGFTEIYQTDVSAWDDKYIPQIEDIRSKKLAPILSVALGLSITQNTDDIKLYKIPDLYEEIRKNRHQEELLNIKDYILNDD